MIAHENARAAQAASEEGAPLAPKKSGPKCRSAERVANIKRLIDELRVRELHRDDIGQLLKFNPSGVRKYVADLRYAGVMMIARYVDGTATYLGHPCYCLTEDTDYVEKFIAEIEVSQRRTRVVTGAKSNIEVAQRTPGRHFHVMADDTYFALRISRAPIVRDSLVAALFGAARARQEEAVAA